MSSQAQTAPTSYTQALEEANISFYIQAAMLALLLYDHVLTFPGEVHLLWRQKFRPSTGLYILIRYPMILESLVPVTINGNSPHCTALLQFSEYMGVLTGLANITFQITRTYAIWNQNWLIVLCLAILIIPSLAIQIWGTVTFSCSNDAFSESEDKIQTIATIAGLVFIFAVVTLTFIKTFQAARAQLRSYSSLGIAGLVLKNGILYFLAIFSCNLFSVLLYFYAPLYLQAIGANITDVLATIIASRFLLDLRAKAIYPNGTSSVQISSMSSIQLAMTSVHGSITAEFGNPLYHTMHEQLRDITQDILLEETTYHAATAIPAINVEELPIDIEEETFA